MPWGSSCTYEMGMNQFPKLGYSSNISVICVVLQAIGASWFFKPYYFTVVKEPNRPKIMNPSKQFAAHIRELIAAGDLQAALDQLQSLLQNSPRLDEVIMQSARFQDIRREIRLGVVDHEQASLTKNQIKAGVLDLLREIETQETTVPVVREEMERFVTMQINGKNIVTGNISAGGNVIIGDTNTRIERQVNMGAGGTYVERQHVTRADDNRSRYLKYAIFGFALPGLFLFLLYWYFVLSRPFSLSVSVQEARPIPGLPFKEGSVTLRYGDKTEKLPIATETIFKQIPASQKAEFARLSFESPGYEGIDTVFSLSENILLPIRRDNSLGHIFGTVKDERGNPVADAQIIVQDSSVPTDALGRFTCTIPFEKQRLEQRIRVVKDGFREWDTTSPVIENEAIGIILKAR